ncbi:MAG: group I intron-associated PD-(D/E)XK endonuclease [Acidimicrobiales bacterium]
MLPATPTEVGARAEAAVASALVRTGKPVFFPIFGVNSRIDLIYQDAVRLVRVQCKTSRIIGEILGFRTCSNTKNTPRGYEGEIDVFGVYSPDLDRVYLVPAAGLPTRFCSLRLAPTRNGQIKGVRRAEDFLLGPP